jgi:glycosyltransferase involved in cell wall biosynthesis
MLKELQELGIQEIKPFAGYPDRPFSKRSDRSLWSVVIPVHNRWDHIDRCVSSVLLQFNNDMEIIVANSGSTDVPDYAKKIWREYKNKVHFAQFHNDLGPGYNWNRAIGLSSGYLIHLLHDDDYVLPEFYSEMANIRLDCGGIICGYENFTDDGVINFSQDYGLKAPSVLDKKLNPFLSTNMTNPPAVVVRRSVYEDFGGYKNEGFVDWDFYLRVCTLSKWTIIPNKLARYRHHQSWSNEGWRKNSELALKHSKDYARIADTYQAVEV